MDTLEYRDIKFLIDSFEVILYMQISVAESDSFCVVFKH